MKIKLCRTFNSLLKIFFKSCWFYYLIWLGLLALICISPSGETSKELKLFILIWIILPFFYSFIFSLAPQLQFTDEVITIFCLNSVSDPHILVIKYSQINYISIAKAPEEISIIYQTANTTTHTAKIYPNEFNLTFREILSYFPANIPIIENEEQICNKD